MISLMGLPAGPFKEAFTISSFPAGFLSLSPKGFPAESFTMVNDSAGNPFGLNDKNPAGKDDIVNASLKGPAGKPIKLIMHSRDVIHNFFVRELRLKQDIVPGMEIPLYFQADTPGTYEI